MLVDDLLGNVEGVFGVEGDAVRVVAAEEHHLVSAENKIGLTLHVKYFDQQTGAPHAVRWSK